MAILMLFNSTDSLSYTEIQAATSIPSADLKRSLQSLACAKVLTHVHDLALVHLFLWCTCARRNLFGQLVHRLHGMLDFSWLLDALKICCSFHSCC